MSVRSQVLKALCVRIKAMNDEHSVPFSQQPWIIRTVKENKCENGNKSLGTGIVLQPPSQILKEPLEQAEILQAQEPSKLKSVAMEETVRLLEPQEVKALEPLGLQKSLKKSELRKPVKVPPKLIPVKVEPRTLRSSQLKNVPKELN